MAIIRHAFIALLLGLVTTNTVSAQAWADKMFKDGLVHDFGVVPKGAQLFHRFTITNIYAVKMEIVNIRSGCGCTSATSSVKVLEPRESATIDVTMDARRFSGPKTVIVYVTVGPEYVSTAEIRVTGNSIVMWCLIPVRFHSVWYPRGRKPNNPLRLNMPGHRIGKLPK